MKTQQFRNFDTLKEIPRVRLEEIKIVVTYDQDPDTSYLEQDGFEDRLREYRSDYFTFVGIYAEATFSTPQGPNTRLLHSLRSGGLWGIESDSGAEHFAEIAREELAQLRDELRTLRVPVRPFKALAAAALDNI